MNTPKPGADTCRRLSTLLMVSALVACSDGYPTQESVLMLSHDMGQQRAMDAMNQLGHQQPSDYHWLYRLLPGCELEVHARKFWGDRAPVRLQLRETDVVQIRDELTEDYSIALVQRDDPTNSTVVLDRLDDVDASQVDWLLRYLPVACDTSRPVPP